MTDTALAHIERAKAELAPLEKLILAFRVTSPEQAQQAAGVATWLHESERQLDEVRKHLKAPSLEAARRIDELFMPQIKVRQRLKQHLKTAVGGYQQEQAEAAARALREATSQAEVARTVAAIAPPPTGMSEREDWDFEIIDLALVPREYLVLDTAKVRSEVRASKDKTTIPGIRAVRRTTMVMR